jgi:hypothetical protein
LKQGTNTEIGPKNFFEIASNKIDTSHQYCIAFKLNDFLGIFICSRFIPKAKRDGRFNSGNQDENKNKEYFISNALPYIGLARSSAQEVHPPAFPENCDELTLCKIGY